MKVLTLGWISIFLIIAIMNIYVWKRYWMIPFKTSKLFKTNIYLFVHLILIIISLYYFYLFFSGKTETRKSDILSKIAGFYLTFLHYSVLFYLLHDFVKFTNNYINYPEVIRYYSDKLFFGGFFIFFIAFLIAIISLFNSNYVKITNYNINIKNKSTNLKDLNIVYISDGHLGVSIKQDDISSIKRNIERLSPDILFLGGDFFDEGTKVGTKKYFAKEISEINTKYGIFFVEGNHEYKSDDCTIDKEVSYFKDEGIIVLQDEIYYDDEFIVIGRKDKHGKNKELKEILDSSIDKSKPIILLDHRPGFKESVKYDYIDIQLSGHTHNGQFFPLSILDMFFSSIKKEYNYGYKKIENLNLIVSSGIGNWAIPSRIGSKREIVNIKVNFN